MSYEQLAAADRYAGPRSPVEVLTHSGVLFNILDPLPEMIDIDDIAHALSMQCRFNGHCNAFYSVAQHSVHVSDLAQKRVSVPIGGRALVRSALLHDAAEAYIGDIVTPIKEGTALFGSPIKSIEDRIMRAIHIKLRVGVNHDNYVVSRIVKECDEIALAHEVRNLRPKHRVWDRLPEVSEEQLYPLSPEASKRSFLATWKRLEI